MTQQSLRQQSCRDFTGEPGGTYEEDWFKVFALSGIPADLTYNEQLYAYLRGIVGDYGTLAGCQYAFARMWGADSWNGLGTFDPLFSFDLNESAFWTRTRASEGTYRDGASFLNFAPVDGWRPDHDDGYIGDLSEETRTNEVRNPDMTGAVVGVIGQGGSFPTDWEITGTSFEKAITALGDEDGYPFSEVAWKGTAGAGGENPSLQFMGNTMVPASVGQVWTGQVQQKLIGASNPNAITRILIQERDAGGNFLTNHTLAFTMTPERTREVLTTTLTEPTVAFVMLRYQWQVAEAVTTEGAWRIYAPQLELGDFASSPIIASGGPNTRAGDGLVMTGTPFSNIYNPAAGTFFIKAQLEGPGALAGFPRIMQADDGTGNNRFSVIHNGGSTDIAIQVFSGAVDQIVSPIVPVGLDPFTVAIAYAPNDISAYVNGVQVVSDVVNTLPVGISGFGLFNNAFLGQDGNGWAESFAYSPDRLPDSVLQAWPG